MQQEKKTTMNHQDHYKVNQCTENQKNQILKNLSSVHTIAEYNFALES